MIIPVRWHRWTSSSCWLYPRCSNHTMPASGRLWDSRLRRIVDSARSVSPWNTGAGKVIFSYPRFPIVVRKVRSGTIIPPIRAAVNRLFTSRRPWGRFALAYSSSRWMGATFIVSEVNRTLSISVTVRVKGWENSAPSSISSKYSPRMPGPLSVEMDHATRAVRTVQGHQALGDVAQLDDLGDQLVKEQLPAQVEVAVRRDVGPEVARAH